MFWCLFVAFNDLSWWRRIECFDDCKSLWRLSNVTALQGEYMTTHTWIIIAYIIMHIWIRRPHQQWLKLSIDREVLRLLPLTCFCAVIRCSHRRIAVKGRKQWCAVLFVLRANSYWSFVLLKPLFKVPPSFGGASEILEILTFVKSTPTCFVLNTYCASHQRYIIVTSARNRD